MTYFPGAVGVRDSCRLCDSGGNTKALLFLPSLHPLHGPYVSLGEVFRESAGFRGCQMCVFTPPFPSYSLPPSPPRWFLHGRRLSIRASGLQEPESTAASLCCPEKRSLVWGGASAAPRGRRVNPGAPLASWLHWKVSSPHLFLQGQRSACFSLCGGAFWLNLNSSQPRVDALNPAEHAEFQTNKSMRKI